MRIDHENRGRRRGGTAVRSLDDTGLTITPATAPAATAEIWDAALPAIGSKLTPWCQYAPTPYTDLQHIESIHIRNTEY